MRSLFFTQSKVSLIIVFTTIYMNADNTQRLWWTLSNKSSNFGVHKTLINLLIRWNPSTEKVYSDSVTLSDWFRKLMCLGVVTPNCSVMGYFCYESYVICIFYEIHIILRESLIIATAVTLFHIWLELSINGFKL